MQGKDKLYNPWEVISRIKNYQGDPSKSNLDKLFIAYVTGDM
jgi:hypothetical protein